MELNNNSQNNLTGRRMALHSLIHLKTISVFEKFMLIFSPKWLLQKKSSLFLSQYSALHVIPASVEQNLMIKPYEGTNQTAISLRNCALSQIKEDIEDIIIHGSIADETTCHYSDFDCLIILKDDVLQSVQRLSRLAAKLWKWQKLMLKTDLLQHHGWFVVFSSDFKCWDQTYLPAEALACSKSLLQKKEYELKIFTNPIEDFKTPFLKLCNELLAITDLKISRMNSYEIKTFISRFFLMPALYYQARYKKGVYKKDSFSLAKNDFAENTWKPVKELSLLRLEWQQAFSPLSFQLINTLYLWPIGMKKIIYPKAPKHIKAAVIQNLPAIKTLLAAMKKIVE